MTPLILAAAFALVALLTMQPVRLVPDAGGDAGGDSGGEPSGNAGEFDSLVNAPADDAAEPAPVGASPAKPPAEQSSAEILAATKAQLEAETADKVRQQEPPPPAVAKPPAAATQLPPAFALTPADLKGIPPEMVGQVQPIIEQALARAYNERAKPYVEGVMQREAAYNEWYAGVQRQLQEPAGQVYQFLQANPATVQPIIDWINSGGQPAQQQMPADPFADIDPNTLDPDTARIVQGFRTAHQQHAQEVATLRALVEQQQGQLRVTAEQQAALEAERKEAEHSAWLRSQESSLQDAFAAAEKALGFKPSDFPKNWGRAVAYMQQVIKATQPSDMAKINYRHLLRDALEHGRFDQLAQRRKEQRRTSAPPPDTGPSGSGAPLDGPEFNRQALANARSDMAAGRPLGRMSG